MKTRQFSRVADFLVCVALLVSLSACSDDTNYDFEASTAQFEAELEAAAEQSLAADTPQPPEAHFSPNPADPVLPFPNSISFLGSQDGSLNIPMSNPAAEPSDDPIAALNQMDGFSTISPIVTTVSKPLDQSTLILGQTVRVFEVPVASAIAVVGPPVEELTDPARMAINQTGNQLALIPLQPLRPNTSYLVALTSGITDMEGRSLIPSISYSLLRSTKPFVDENLLPLEPLRQATNTHLDLLNPVLAEGEKVVLSWIFKTQSIIEPLQAVKDISTASPLVLSSAGISTAQANPALPGFADIWAGALTIPYYLTATSATNTPQDVLNSFWTNDEGNPVGSIGASGMQNFTPTATTTETIPVLLSVPNATAGAQIPDAGWPVTIFVHGFTGDRSNMLGVADSMAAAGRAVIAIDMPLHGIVDPASPLYASPDENGVGPRERTFDLDVDMDGATDASGTHFNN
ncbi:MAG: Ig-like domain-containing protein, partial [Granulosicoccus sp.]